MKKVFELVPADRVELPGNLGRSTVLITYPHPLWPDLALVVWITDDDRIFFDALNWKQDIGTVINSEDSNSKRLNELRDRVVGKEWKAV